MIGVSACLVTRGDVDMSPILESLPEEWEKIVWDNSGERSNEVLDGVLYLGRDNLAVYGRYAAIEYASGDLCYVQDDDVIVSDPQALVREWNGVYAERMFEDTHVVCNMPEAHRSQPFYKEHALVGYGAVFHRDAPARAFQRYWDSLKVTVEFLPGAMPGRPTTLFERRCDVVFTALTPRVLVDVPVRNLPYYDAPNRSWKQKDHFKERKRMLELALSVRDA